MQISSVSTVLHPRPRGHRLRPWRRFTDVLDQSQQATVPDDPQSRAGAAGTEQGRSDTCPHQRLREDGMGVGRMRVEAEHEPAAVVVCAPGGQRPGPQCARSGYPSARNRFHGASRPARGEDRQLRHRRRADERAALVGSREFGDESRVLDHLGDRVGSPLRVDDHRHPGTVGGGHDLTRPGEQTVEVRNLRWDGVRREEGQLVHLQDSNPGRGVLQRMQVRPTARTCPELLRTRLVPRYRMAAGDEGFEPVAVLESDGANAGRLGTLGALADLELDALVLLEGAEAATLDLGVVDENVSGSVFGGDEAESLFRVEPLHSALCHAVPSLSNTGCGGRRSQPTGPVPTAVPLIPPQESIAHRARNIVLRARTRTQKLRPGVSQPRFVRVQQPKTTMK
ncbi:hypothetical protein RHCRD62_100015 [Rhodococcus sp. RD6.2]|nr:hypothetical protein RHCRD62_100015 [Rhodococcus sp. RD6.2]